MSVRRSDKSRVAVLFDLDGLLVDSEPLWYAVESAAVARLGGVWGRKHQAACIGGTLDRACAYMLQLTGADRSPDALRDEILGEMVAGYRNRLPLLAGALDLLDALSRRSVPMGLVSSSYRVLVDAALVVLGERYFAVSVAGDEVACGKPAPHPYLAACALLGVDPATVVVLEDTITGVNSAEAAGCAVVAVPSVAPIEARPGRPVVASLADIDPDWLLGLTAGASASR